MILLLRVQLYPKFMLKYYYPFRAQIVAKLQRFCMDRNSAK